MIERASVSISKLRSRYVMGFGAVIGSRGASPDPGVNPSMNCSAPDESTSRRVFRNALTLMSSWAVDLLMVSV